jgi:hypothetical protein
MFVTRSETGGSNIKGIPGLSRKGSVAFVEGILRVSYFFGCTVWVEPDLFQSTCKG